MLVKSLKRLGQTVIEILQTRMEILSLDVKEARIRFVSILMLYAFTFFSLSLGIVFGAFWLIIKFWETNRLLVVGILAVGFLACGLILMVVLVRRLRNGPRPFEGTIAELNKDRDVLVGRGKGNQ
jgi:uncharacterized membrane protein YqjE